jgi:hypothetical protein
MDISEKPVPDKSPAATVRRRMPHRRESTNTSFEHNGAQFEMTAGHYPNGSIGEVFLNAARANSQLDIVVADAAIAVSLALQFGCPLETIAHAMKRDTRGNPASPIGSALDRIAP